MTTLAAAPAARPAALRRALLGQIARLEAELPPGPGGRSPARPRLQTTAELERIRDDLWERIRERRFTAGEEQERKRRLREEMLLDPAAHRGARVTNAEVGEPGCGAWLCLGKWFRVRLAGGCP